MSRKMGRPRVHPAEGDVWWEGRIRSPLELAREENRRLRARVLALVVSAARAALDAADAERALARASVRLDELAGENAELRGRVDELEQEVADVTGRRPGRRLLVVG